jgi:hypothetical protein
MPLSFVTAHAKHAKPSQVYQQKFKYRIVVVVNVGTHLWINPVFSTRSSVYAQYKAVGCHCICGVSKLDKISACGKNHVFAQSVPVDMQMLIHSG